jgi:replicative DNA helicase
MVMTASTTVNPQPANDSPQQRTMPHNNEAEQILLGALLVNNNNLEKVSEFLKAQHFYLDIHARIFEALTKLIDRGQDASPVTLKQYFQDDTALADLGGGKYLDDLADNIISVVDVQEFGRQIHELHLRRALIILGEDIVNDAYKPDLDLSPTDQIGDAEQQLFELATQGDFKGGFVPLITSVTAAIKTAEQSYQHDGGITGVTTGLVDLDKKLGGLQNSDLLILAGRPSMGKSALATNIGYNAARRYSQTDGKEGAVVGIFQLEMSAEQLANRILADETCIPSDQIRRGEIKDTDFQKFVEASTLMSQTPMFIDDTPGLTVNSIRTRARRLKRTHNLGLIIIDYLQLLMGSSKASQQNRVQEVSEISRGLKILAKELEIPVVALAQLSRAVEQRENKRPQLADLRESGSIEQDADVVMFVYREQYYLERDEPARRPEEDDSKFNARYADWQQRCQEAHNVAECIVAKQRHGPIGTVRMQFTGEFTRFSDLDMHHQFDS